MLRYIILSSAGVPYGTYVGIPRDLFHLCETERPIWITRLGDSFAKFALESLAPELDIEIYHGAAIGPNLQK